MENFFNHLKRFLRICRVKDWLHYLGYVLLGCAISENFNVFYFIISFFMLAYAYSINDYYDKKMNKKYFLLPLLFSIFSLLFLFSLNLFSFVFSTLFLTIFTFYSWPKVWLEGKPILSTLTNGIGFTLLLILPFNSFQKIIKYSSFIFLVFLLNIAAQLIHEIVDYKDDKKIKKITTCVKFGIRNTFFTFKFLLLVIMLTSLSLFPVFPFVSIATIFFSIFFLATKRINKSIRKKFKKLGVVCGSIYFLEFFIKAFKVL